MQTLTIEAASLRSAEGIALALSDFQHELIREGGRSWVRVTLPANDQGIVAVLDALEAHVASRGRGSTRVRFNGQNYAAGTKPLDA